MTSIGNILSVTEDTILGFDGTTFTANGRNYDFPLTIENNSSYSYNSGNRLGTSTSGGRREGISGGRREGISGGRREGISGGRREGTTRLEKYTQDDEGSSSDNDHDNNNIVITLNFSAPLSLPTHYIIVGGNNLTFQGETQNQFERERNQLERERNQLERERNQFERERNQLERERRGENELHYPPNPNITVTSASYPGLIANNNPANYYTNIIIRNINLNGVTGSGATLVSGTFVSPPVPYGSGWIVQANSWNVKVKNSYSSGDIVSTPTSQQPPSYTGGIFGSGCTNCIAKHCYSSGLLSDEYSGGIFGAYTNYGATGATCLAIKCSSSGNIADEGGGIFAPSANLSTTNSICKAVKCSSTAADLGANGGGIYGSQANYCGPGQTTNSTCIAIQCFSTGTIGFYGGGIFGYYANYAAAGSTCEAIRCYSTGDITSTNPEEDGPSSGGGIFSQYANEEATNCTCIARRCYSTGPISQYSGGIFGGEANDSSTSSICQAIQCYSTGPIGPEAGGIYGSLSNGDGGNDGSDGANNSSCQAIQCFSLGSIGAQGGGIFGDYTNYYQGTGSTCTATLCYSRGNIASQGGGIFGFSAGNCTANECYSIGILADPSSSGSIFGQGCSSVSAINCYVANGSPTEQYFGSGSTLTSVTNSITEIAPFWQDKSANRTIALGPFRIEWASLATDTPYILAFQVEQRSIVPFAALKDDAFNTNLWTVLSIVIIFFLVVGLLFSLTRAVR